MFNQEKENTGNHDVTAFICDAKCPWCNKDVPNIFDLKSAKNNIDFIKIYHMNNCEFILFVEK